MEQERIPDAKLEIITNGVDLARFANGRPAGTVRQALGVSASAPLVGIVAMLRPEKAHDVFLRAAARAAAHVPEARFLIIGDGPTRPQLEALAAELGLQGKVLFLGARSDVPELVKAIDLAVLSSHPVVETLSNAVLEYMAAGKPVLATRVGSVPEQVQDGVTGCLVDPGDWQALGDRIAELLLDADRARRMGQAGRALVEARYTIDRMVRGHERLFERLLNA
jgi:glycosyltransferase involved in cell wall biosynthesis